MTAQATELRTKRVYDQPEPVDGYRILVDRLWPRGMTHERAALDLWLPRAARARSCAPGRPVSVRS